MLRENKVYKVRIIPSKTYINTLEKRGRRDVAKWTTHTHSHMNVCPLNETIKISQKGSILKKRLRGESATSGHCAAAGKSLEKNGILKKIHIYFQVGVLYGIVSVCLCGCGLSAVKTRLSLPNLLPLNCATFAARQLFDKRLTLRPRQINRLATK